MKKKNLLFSTFLMFLVVGPKSNAVGYTNDEIQKIQDIKERYEAIENKEKPVTYNDYFSELPIVGEGGQYSTGRFTDQTKQVMSDQLNYYRYLANLPAITLNEDIMPLAQKGAVGLAAVDKHTHKLSEEKQPEGMSDEFWQEAQLGVKNIDKRVYQDGNIMSSPQNDKLFYHIHNYIYDFGDANFGVGHRISLLGMEAEKFSFGYAQRPNSMSRETFRIQGTKVTKKSDIDYQKDTIVTWPPKGVAPTNIFSSPHTNEYLRWSLNLYGGKKWMSEPGKTEIVSYGYKVDNDTKITLTNNGTGKTTEFISNDDDNRLIIIYDANSKLVFQPKIEDYKPGDVYTVKVTGLMFNDKPTNYEYQVKLFDINSSENIPVETIRLSPDKKEMNIDEKFRLTASITPDNATNKTITWKSSNSRVAEVDNQGNVHALAEGDVKITATTEDGNKEAHSAISVKKETSEYENKSFETAKKINIDDVQTLENPTNHTLYYQIQPTKDQEYRVRRNQPTTSSIYDEDKKEIKSYTPSSSLDNLDYTVSLKANRPYYISISTHSNNKNKLSFIISSLVDVEIMTNNNLKVGESDEIKLINKKNKQKVTSKFDLTCNNDSVKLENNKMIATKEGSDFIMIRQGPFYVAGMTIEVREN